MTTRKRKPGGGRKPLKLGDKLEIVSFGIPKSEHDSFNELCRVLEVDKSKLIRHAIFIQYNIGTAQM